MPWFVQCSREHYTYCCCYHVDFGLMYIVFHSLDGHRRVVPTIPRDFIHSILCAQDGDSLHHSLNYVEGRYTMCDDFAKVPQVVLHACDM